MMLRSMNNVLPARKLLNHYPIEFQIATFTRTPINFKYKDPKEREPCPKPPPPPPPPPKDDKMFWGAMAVLFCTGGFVIYAGTNPEVRDWLSLNAPWIDDIVAIVYQENMTYGELISACINDTKKYLARFKGDNKPKECSTGGKTVKDGPGGSKCGEPPPPAKACVPEVCAKPPPPIEMKSLCEVEKCIIELAECAIKNYNTARDACSCYNMFVQDNMTTFTYKSLKELKHAMEERIELVKTSLDNASSCVVRVDDMARYIDCGVKDTKERINNTKLMHRDYQEKFKAAFMEYQWENDKSVVMDSQWQIVEQMVVKYASENEHMFTGLKYDCEKPPHVSGDLDALFINSVRYIQELTEQLKDASGQMTERVNRAIDDLPQKGTPAFAQAMAAAVKKAKTDAANDYQRREAEQKKRNERFLKDSLKKQTQNYEQNLITKLVQIEEQVKVKFDKMVAEKVAAEKLIFAHDLQKMARKLKLVEDRLEARLKAERETRRSQELWAAGASLLAATKKGDPYVRVDKELKAIEKASGDDDKLVLTVLKSIPKSVREKGIVPESVLRDRFRTMEKTARSVALVEQEGATMPVYMLSWLQGLLLFMRLSGIPQREFEKPPLAPPEHLDTFDLLQRARFWVERGNLAVAVRYVDSLKGASRAAANKWFEAARAHLEVRQAAEAVLAHAAAMGLRYI